MLSGDDNLVFPIMALGGTGVISVASNIVPGQDGRRWSGAALKGDWDSARKMHYELLPLFRAIFIETNPIPVKAALAMKGMMRGDLQAADVPDGSEEQGSPRGHAQGDEGPVGAARILRATRTNTAGGTSSARIPRSIPSACSAAAISSRTSLPRPRPCSRPR